MDLKILVADDDFVLRELLCDILQEKGYQTLEAADGEEAISVFFKETGIALVILDVMMPKCNGWEVLKEIRSYSDTPVLMLTALDDEKHEIQGLSHGADDYVTKPFSYQVLLARVQALLRKTINEQKETAILGKLKIDYSSHKVYSGEEEISLNNKEYSLLLYLVQNKKIVLSREQILNAVWGFDYEGDIRTIDTHIKRLRSKMKDCSSYIHTIRGNGYCFEAVEEWDESEDVD